MKKNVFAQILASPDFSERSLVYDAVRGAFTEKLVAAAQDFLGGFRISETALREASPIRIPSDFRQQTTLVFDLLFERDELVCLNTDYVVLASTNRPERVDPFGPGTTLPAKQWVELIKSVTWFKTSAGVWVRMNPLIGQTGSGKFGEHVDADVAACRFILVEFDVIPLEFQLPLLCMLNQPVAMICSSGGRSYHAWVVSDCPDRESYDRKVGSINRALEKFGVDPSNGCPSIYSRLPGCIRGLGAVRAGEQRMVYFNPGVSTEEPIFRRL
jgi:hypothetical protein